MINPRHFLRALAILAVFHLGAVVQATELHTVKVTLSGKGVVELFSSPPATEGDGTRKLFTRSGSVKLEADSFVELFFDTATGYRIESVTVNGFDITSEVIGPVTAAATAEPVTPPVSTFGFFSFDLTENHHFVVRYVIDSPLGDFGLAFKEGAGSSILDVTGPYTGFLPTKGNPYTLDVAMDESGKLIGMGTVDGFVNSHRNFKDTNQFEIKGSLKTQNGVPTASGSASGKGMLDGEDVSGSGKLKLPISFTPDLIVEGITLSASAKEGGVRSVERTKMGELLAKPEDVENVQEDWNLTLTLAEMENAKGKKFVAASAILNLPNGEKTQFREKKVTYSLKNGYSVNFGVGVQLDAQGIPIMDEKGRLVLDRKSRIMISKALFERNGDAWVPTTGVLKYRFLGQKGVGDLVNFLQ